MPEPHDKILYLDVLTVLSCFSVVYLHTNGIFWTHPKGVTWVTANIIETFFYFAVPIFFMITGVTLIDFHERYSIKTYLIKRCKRTLIPFLFWSVIAFFITSTMGGLPQNALKDGFLLAIFNTKILQIYWFFPPLFACYLSIIVLSYIEDKNAIFTFMAGWAFFTYSLLPFCRRFFGLEISGAYGTLISGGHLIFVLLGYLLGKDDIPKTNRFLIYYCGIIGFFLHCYMTIKLSPAGLPINKMFKGYTNFPSVFQAAAVFTFARYQNWSFLFRSKIVTQLFYLVRDASLGVYLIHVFILRYALPPVFNYLDMPAFRTSLIYRLVAPIFVTLACALITKFIKKIPFLKYTVG